MEYLGPFDLDALCALAGFTREKAAAYCGVSERTLRRWMKEPPLIALRLFNIHARGFLPDSKHWQRFTIDSDGNLHTEFDQVLSTGDIHAWFFKEQLLENLKAENRQLRQKLANVAKLTHSANDSVFNERFELKDSDSYLY